MCYDLIVVGGGPAGLMAAKIAAEDGLRVILVERKKNIAKILTILKVRRLYKVIKIMTI